MRHQPTASSIILLYKMPKTKADRRSEKRDDDAVKVNEAIVAAIYRKSRLAKWPVSFEDRNFINRVAEERARVDAARSQSTAAAKPTTAGDGTNAWFKPQRPQFERTAQDSVPTKASAEASPTKTGRTAQPRRRQSKNPSKNSIGQGGPTASVEETKSVTISGSTTEVSS